MKMRRLKLSQRKRTRVRGRKHTRITRMRGFLRRRKFLMRPPDQPQKKKSGTSPASGEPQHPHL